MKNETLLLTKAELAQHLRISDRQIDRLKDQLPRPIKVGEQHRWSRLTIETWIKCHEPAEDESSNKGGHCDVCCREYRPVARLRKLDS